MHISRGCSRLKAGLPVSKDQNASSRSVIPTKACNLRTQHPPCPTSTQQRHAHGRERAPEVG
eukprot:3122542-Pyramimonas_sp.AAC.1